MNAVRALMISAALLGSAVVAQDAFPFGTEGGTQGFGGFGFGPAAQQQEFYTVTGKASVTTYKAGEPFYIALNGKVADTYHAYWRNPGSVGEPITATLTAPEGFKVEGPYWEVPHRVVGDFSTAYSYEAPIAVWKVTPEATAPQQAEFSIESSAQTCNDNGCNPAETKTATVIISAGDGAANAAWAAEETKVETLGDTPITVTAAQSAQAVTLTISGVDNIGSAYFFSEDNSINPVVEQELKKADTGYTITLPRNDNSDPMHPAKDETLVGKKLKTLKGILSFDGKHATVNVDFSAPTAAAPTTAKPTAAGAKPTDKKAPGFLIIIGSLFLGGLILNFMPCVFPVIGLKIMSFVEMGGGDRKKVFLHSAIFSLGIILSFIALAILLLFSTDADNRSWAMWMQNPWVVYAILLLLLTLGLSMFGVFEIGVGATSAGQGLQNKQGLTGSFFQGIFITIVATPCSAPFLGSALPLALALPDVEMVTALGFMGLGLAFPYILLGALPQLMKFLPRPGAWMESLKQGLSFLLFAAAAWILDTYLVMISEDARMLMLICLTIYAAAFWVYGRWCPMYLPVRTRIIGGIFALLLLGLGVWGTMPAPAAKGNSVPERQTSYTVAKGDTPIWNTWSPALMEQALKDGHPVYVDFTAKWCATCQFNKKVAYSAEVCKKFEDAGVVLMRADKTKPNAAIDAEMSKLGRSQVPTNVIYVPAATPGEAPATHITIEVFNADYLSGFISEHLGNFAPAAAPAPTTQEAVEAPAEDEEDATDEDAEEEEEVDEEEETEEESAE